MDHDHDHDHDRRLTIRIELPAVNDLVAYLNNRDNQQKQIDELTAEVAKVTEQLKKSSAGLQGTVEANQ